MNLIQDPPVARALLTAILVVGITIGGVYFYKQFLRVSRSAAVGIFFLSFLAGVGVLAYRGVFNPGWRPSQTADPEFNPVWRDLAAALLALVAVPFVIKIYRAWLGGHLTDAEKSPGMPGVRAWLGGGNLICALLIAAFAALGFHYPFGGVFVLTLTVLLAYPLLNMNEEPVKPAEPAGDPGLSAERERVLKMLDDGKINAEESAELLHALSRTVQPRTPPPPTLSPHRKTVLIGSALLLIGFFLPWFSYNPGVELARMADQLHQAIPANSGGVPMTSGNVSLNLPVTTSVRISGGDIRYGLGWLVLLLGIAAAALPYLATDLDRQTRQKAQLIGLGIGGIILLYLLTQNLRYVSIGIVLGLAGYALQFVGAVREGKLVFR